MTCAFMKFLLLASCRFHGIIFSLYPRDSNAGFVPVSRYLLFFFIMESFSYLIVKVQIQSKMHVEIMVFDLYPHEYMKCAFINFLLSLPLVGFMV